MPIYYNSKAVIPAPFVSVDKSYDRTADGHKVGSKFIINLKGTLTCDGSPNSRGEFYTGSGYPPASFQNDVEVITSVTQKQKVLQAKIQAIRHLFATDGYAFEVQPWDGSSPMKCYPRVQNLSFSEGQWVDKVEYTVTLEADELFGINNAYTNDAEDAALDQDFFKDADDNKLYLADVSENWQLELVDSDPENVANPFTFRLTHNVSATGKRAYDDSGLVSEGWEQAQRWVIPRLGLDNAFLNSTDAMNLSSMLAFNHVRNENTDELSGSYSVSETWIITKSNAREDFTVSTQTSLETGLTTVSVEGEVVGLDTRNSSYVITETRYTAAAAKFTSISGDIFNRAQTYSGVTLNSTLLSSSVGRNPLSGRITYNYQYDTRPTNCITGSLAESIVISDKNPTDIFAVIPVIGRAAGPVLQDMGTQTERHRSVSIDISVAPVSICPSSAANVALLMAASPESEVNDIILAFEEDLSNSYNQVFREEDNPSWNPRNGKYSRSVSWTYQNCT